MLAIEDRRRIQLDLQKIALIGASSILVMLVGTLLPVALKAGFLAAGVVSGFVAIRRLIALSKGLDHLKLTSVPGPTNQAVASLGRLWPTGYFVSEGSEILVSNAAWDELIGRRDAETANAALARTAYLADAQAQRELLQKASDGGEAVEFVVRHTAETGIVRHLHTFAAPLDPRSRQVVGLTVDVTETVRREVETNRHEREKADVQRLLRLSMTEMNSSIEALVKVLVRAVEAKDPYTAGHSERVTSYALLIGQAMGLCFHDLRILEIGCLVHDIGKIGVPDELLTKRSSLTKEEFQIVAAHAAIGSEILADLPLFHECLPIVRGHHERLDGSGYPDALAGDEIPEIVRIATVADSFDAMTSTRAYRKGMDPAVAIEELQKEASQGRLDPQVVGVLADMVKREGLPDRLNRTRHSKNVLGSNGQPGASIDLDEFFGNENAA